MTNEIIENLNYSADKGALQYRDVRYLLIRPETVQEIFRALIEEIGADKAGEVFYRAGHRGGSLSAAHFREELALQPEEIVSFMADMGGQLGWGKMEIRKLDVPNGSLKMEVTNSVFAKGYGDADRPVCHMIRGVFAGTWGGAIQREVAGIESRCRAVKGDEPCTFVFTASG